MHPANRVSKTIYARGLGICRESTTSSFSLNQAAKFFPQTSQHPRLGEIDHVDRNAQIPGDFRRRLVVDDVSPTGLPARWAKLGLHQLGGTPDEKDAVFGFLEQIHLAGNANAVNRLVQRLADRRAFRRWKSLARWTVIFFSQPRNRCRGSYSNWGGLATRTASTS